MLECSHSTNPAALLRAWRASEALGGAIAQSSAIGARWQTSSGVVGSAPSAELSPATPETNEQNEQTEKRAAAAVVNAVQLAKVCSLAVLEHVEIAVPTPVECAERSLDSTHFLLVGLEVLVLCVLHTKYKNQTPKALRTVRRLKAVISYTYLLQDGRILFLDPIVEGKKFAEIKAGKDPVCSIC